MPKGKRKERELSDFSKKLIKQRVSVLGVSTQKGLEEKHELTKGSLSGYETKGWLPKTTEKKEEIARVYQLPVSKVDELIEKEKKARKKKKKSKDSKSNNKKENAANETANQDDSSLPTDVSKEDVSAKENEIKDHLKKEEDLKPILEFFLNDDNKDIVLSLKSILDEGEEKSKKFIRFLLEKYKDKPLPREDLSFAIGIVSL